jgi:hypothetical protein
VCAESPEFPLCEIHLPAAEFEKAPFDLSQSDPISLANAK